MGNSASLILAALLSPRPVFSSSFHSPGPWVALEVAGRLADTVDQRAVPEISLGKTRDGSGGDALTSPSRARFGLSPRRPPPASSGCSCPPPPGRRFPTSSLDLPDAPSSAGPVRPCKLDVAQDPCRARPGASRGAPRAPGPNGGAGPSCRPGPDHDDQDHDQDAGKPRAAPTASALRRLTTGSAGGPEPRASPSTQQPGVTGVTCGNPLRTKPARPRATRRARASPSGASPDPTAPAGAAGAGGPGSPRNNGHGRARGARPAPAGRPESPLRRLS